MLEWVDPKSTPKIVKPFSVSSKKKFYIDNNDRTAHFVGYFELTPMDIIDFHIKKQTNENMEAEIEEMDVKQGKNAYSEDDNFDEAIPIQIKNKEQQKHTKRKLTKISEPLTKMRIEQ